MQLFLTSCFQKIKARVASFAFCRQEVKVYVSAVCLLYTKSQSVCYFFCILSTRSQSVHYCRLLVVHKKSKCILLLFASCRQKVKDSITAVCFLSTKGQRFYRFICRIGTRKGNSHRLFPSRSARRARRGRTVRRGTCGALRQTRLRRQRNPPRVPPSRGPHAAGRPVRTGLGTAPS